MISGEEQEIALQAMSLHIMWAQSRNPRQGIPHTETGTRSLKRWAEQVSTILSRRSDSDTNNSWIDEQLVQFSDGLPLWPTTWITALPGLPLFEVLYPSRQCSSAVLSVKQDARRQFSGPAGKACGLWTPF